MGVCSFFSLEDNREERIHKLLCLGCWSLGGILYVINFVYSILWTVTFPGFAVLTCATWLSHIALRIFSLWVPMSFLLIQWRMKGFALILYIAGGVLAILLSLTSALLLLNYTNHEALKDEYFNSAKARIDNGDFPNTLSRAASIDSCCSWYGPSDFVDTYNIADQRDGNEEFMISVAHCCGDIFAVEKSSTGAGLRYFGGIRKPSGVPADCASVYLKRADSISILITFVAVVVCLYTPIMIYAHFRNYKKLGLGMDGVVRPNDHINHVGVQVTASNENATVAEEVLDGQLN